MTDPIATFPNETYLNGLRNADLSVVDALYHEFRQPIAKAVQAAGGTYADGGTFFRVAIIHTARLIHEDKYPVEAPIYLFLKNLSVAQYRDWLLEKEQEIPPIAEPSEEEIPVIAALPDPAALHELRMQIRAKRQFSKLQVEDQKNIQTLATLVANHLPEMAATNIAPYTKSIDRLKILLGERGKTWETPLPSWVAIPLTDTLFHKTWSACEALERRMYSSQVPASNENKTIRNAFILMLLLTVGFAAYTWIIKDRSPVEVYEHNFNPPASIMDDMALRYAKDSIAPVRPEACISKFREADAYYKNKEWYDAATSLASMIEDSLSVCQSDVFFYLAIVGLQLENPDLTLECISKIEDLDRYGEDIYWYMALAYVKMAAIDPEQKDIARRAVQRALSNTEIPERRTRAEKMLEELAE
jgi:hypothetical protein